MPAAHASRRGQALVDRRLYLPRRWAEDAARRAKVSVPPETGFATKPALARETIAAARDAGVACAWVLADALCGSDHRLRRMLEDRGQPCVLAVRMSQSAKVFEGWSPVLSDPAAMARAIPDSDWQRQRLADAERRRGREGPTAPPPGPAAAEVDRRSRLRALAAGPAQPARPRGHGLLLAHAPQGTSLAELAGAAGLRWSIEQAFQPAKDDLGLDHCEARPWHGRHRHTTLVRAAAAHLAKLSADRRRHAFCEAHETSPAAAAA